MTFRRRLYDAGMTEPVRVPLPDWIAALAAARPFGVGDRRGTANLARKAVSSSLMIDWMRPRELRISR